MKSSLLFLGALCVVVGSPIGDTLSHTLNDGIHRELNLVATVEGKSFFIDMQPQLSWFAASAYCQELGLKLASITSPAQFEALNNSSIPFFPQTSYWLSGRDSQELDQFRWNETNSHLGSYLPLWKYYYPGYQTCVTFMRSPTGDSYVSYWPCENTLYIMCATA